MIEDAQWLGLVARSESDFPHEWQPIQWVVRNRIASKRYPNTFQGVITQPRQFSYLNQFNHLANDEAIYEAAIDGYAGDMEGWGENNLDKAVNCAYHVLGLPRYRAPFSHNTFWFWSPISMRPKGSDPAWSKDLRIFTLDGIDPQRFKFAERR